MEVQGFGVLSLLVFLPVAGALAASFVPRNLLGFHRWWALLISAFTLFASLQLYVGFSGNTFHFQWREGMDWLPALGIRYQLGVDGISLWLILLTSLISFLGIWFSFHVRERVKEFMIWLLILEGAMIGVFCALDLVLFYIFFEATLIPMYFLISIWGGKNRVYSSVKFFLFTFLGSIFMLVAIVALYFISKAATGEGTFDLIALQALAADGRLATGPIEMWLFAAFALAFAVKVPLFPVHTWLPDAHTEAPTAGSMILAAIMLKMGTYGFLRFAFPLFPDAAVQAAPFLMGLSVVGIIYGAIMAAVQEDWKRLVAYSSVSHLGFVMLGIFSLNHNGLTGGTLQAINHGISTGALFLLVGMVYERTHTRLFQDYGGLKRRMPMFATLFLLIMLSSVGLPSTNGFIGEFLAMLGAFQAGANANSAIPLWMPVLAGAGVVLAAVYLLWMFQKVFYGPIRNPVVNRLRDIRPWEQAVAWVFVVFVFWLGLYPKFFTDKMQTSLNAVRHQTLQPPGARPAWADVRTIDINANGDVVVVQRDDLNDLGRWTEVAVRTPSGHQPQRLAMRGGEE
ncbi:MAG: Fe-S-binding domain-containing protein [Armatimonadota bacterium]